MDRYSERNCGMTRSLSVKWKISFERLKAPTRICIQTNLKKRGGMILAAPALSGTQTLWAYSPIMGAVRVMLLASFFPPLCFALSRYPSFAF